MTDDDPWHYHRDALARQYLDQFESRLSSALVLFGPRRFGKTEFLLRDLGPNAQAQGWKVVYANFWQSKFSPAAVLLCALDGANKRGSLTDRAEALAKATKATIKVSGRAPGGGPGAEATFDLSDLAGPPPADILLQLEAQIDRFAPKGKRALLLLDEVQELAESADNAALVAALRTSLDTRRDRLAVVFTGSSQEALRKMFSSRAAPFFHFATAIDLPPLDDGLVAHTVSVFEKVVRGRLNIKELSAAFSALDRNPFYFRQLIETLALDPKRDIAGALSKVRARAAEAFRFPETWKEMTPLQKQAALAIARDDAQLFSESARRAIGETLGQKPPSRAQMLAALRFLVRNNVIYRTGDRGGYAFQDAEFQHWVLSA